jgi:hypothetical protein
MATSVMLDIETLGFRPNCVVLSLGAVKFNAQKATIYQLGLDLKLDVDQQLSIGRTVDDSTVEWWSKQHPLVIEEAMTGLNRVSLENFRQQLNKFLVGADEIWAQGPVFDIAILENLYEQMQWPFPWNYWQIRDSRTLFAVHGDSRVKQQGKLHNAMEDAKSQAQAVIDVYKKLNLTVDS